MKSYYIHIGEKTVVFYESETTESLIAGLEADKDTKGLALNIKANMLLGSTGGIIRADSAKDAYGVLYDTVGKYVKMKPYNDNWITVTV